jgi:hypothetical protein
MPNSNNQNSWPEDVMNRVLNNVEKLQSYKIITLFTHQTKSIFIWHSINQLKLAIGHVTHAAT